MIGTRSTIPSGIAPLDDRAGGLEAGGTYLLVGSPGPEKMVAALQFVHAGIRAGERCALVTNGDAENTLEVAAAWGFDLREAWESGRFQLVGFTPDFELRAIRSIAPEEVVEELDALLQDGLTRIAVDPGAMFLTGGAKTLLGATFLSWARGLDATVMATFSVDRGAAFLPSSADWLINATTARFLLERRDDGLYEITVAHAVPAPDRRDETITLQLEPGRGLARPDRFPSRRGVDRSGVDERRLLLVTLSGEEADDLGAWAARSFETDVVSDPLEAVARLQSDPGYGGVLIHTARERGREALQTCRVLRPLTRAAVILASDDAVRATDRIRALEAGADDFMSGGLDYRELGLRIRQAIARGSAPMVDRGTSDISRTGTDLVPENSDGGRVPLETFMAELERRRADPELSYFCVLDVSSTQLRAGELASRVAQEVRSEDGDIVTTLPDRCLALLQGARETQLGPFVARLRQRLAEDAKKKTVEIDVLSHPADAERILAVLESTGASAA